jgi:hypothetical protein
VQQRVVEGGQRQQVGEGAQVGEVGDGQRPRAQFVQEANVGRLQRPQAVEQVGAQVGGRRPVARRRGLLGQRPYALS